jgi:hypothetical protein
MPLNSTKQIERELQVKAKAQLNLLLHSSCQVLRGGI